MLMRGQRQPAQGQHRRAAPELHASPPTISSTDAASFEPLILAYRNGAAVRLSDVANVVDGVENAQLAGWAGDKPRDHPERAAPARCQRDRGRRPRARRCCRSCGPRCPGPSRSPSSATAPRPCAPRSRTCSSRCCSRSALVVAVIYLFLRSLRATIIPGVAVPLSLIGTFGVMYLFGYSLNNLTLMALTISTGFVVDDAIVMIENISRYIEEGEKPFEAALKGASQIGFTIVSLTVSLVAVLIPLLFMGGIIGRLFREFAVTLSVAIGVSAVLSLTLTAMMCAYMLKPHEQRAARPAGARLGSADRLAAAHLRHEPDGGAAPPAAHAARHARDGAADRASRVRHPQGLLLRSRTPGILLGVSEAPADVSFPRMLELQQRARREWCWPTRTSRAWRRSSAPTAPTPPPTVGACRSRSSRASSAPRRRVTGHRALCRAAARRARASAVPAARAGSADRQPREPHAVPVHAGGCRSRRAARLGAAPRWRRCATLPQLTRRGERSAERGARV